MLTAAWKVSLFRAETGHEKYQARNSFETKFPFDSATRKRIKCPETYLFILDCQGKSTLVIRFTKIKFSENLKNII